MTADEIDKLRTRGDTPLPLFPAPDDLARRNHPAIARLADDQGPMGVAAQKILTDLNAAYSCMAVLEAEVEEQRAYRTLGGPPRKPGQRWVNAELPAEVHGDYQHLDAGSES